MIASDLNEAALAGLKEAGVAECVQARCPRHGGRRGAGQAAGRRSTCSSTPRASCITAAVLDCSEEDWDFSFDLNVKSMHRTIKAFLPGMLSKGKGSIVNIASTVGASKAAPNRYVYARHQGRRRRPHQGGGHGFHRQGHPLQLHLPRHHPDAVARRPHQGARASRSAARTRRARCSSSASRWAGSARAEEMAHVAVYLASDESGLHDRLGHHRRRRLYAL